MALVSETSVLSHHSVADNLRIAHSERLLSNEYLEDIASLTNLHEAIGVMPKVYSI